MKTRKFSTANFIAPVNFSMCDKIPFSFHSIRSCSNVYLVRSSLQELYGFTFNINTYLYVILSIVVLISNFRKPDFVLLYFILFLLISMKWNVYHFWGKDFYSFFFLSFILLLKFPKLSLFLCICLSFSRWWTTRNPILDS